MNDNTAPQPQPRPAPKQPGDRTPIPIDRLLFSGPNPAGIAMPDGRNGLGTRIRAYLSAGLFGDEKVAIDRLPWLRVFRVTRSWRITRSGANGKETVSWEPMGKPFDIPETWAVSVPIDG